MIITIEQKNKHQQTHDYPRWTQSSNCFKRPKLARAEDDLNLIWRCSIVFVTFEEQGPYLEPTQHLLDELEHSGFWTTRM